MPLSPTLPQQSLLNKVNRIFHMIMAGDLQQPHLLLLPWPSEGTSRAALNSLYRPTLSAVLRRLSHNDSPATLVIAVACPALEGPESSISRPVKWAYAQSLLAALYVIVASVCTEKGIATDVGAVEKGSVDVRILLVDYTQDRDYSSERLIDSEDRGNGTTVPDLIAFSRRRQSWKTVFHPSSEEGYGLLREFLKLAEGKMKILQEQLVAVDCGIMLTSGEEAHNQGHSDQPPSLTKPYNIVCLGGTFDHLHVGHKLLLHATALLVADTSEQMSELIVGISGDALLVKKQYAEELQPWTSRARSVTSFLETVIDLKVSAINDSDAETKSTPQDNEELQAHMRDGRLLVRCVNIPDPFGPTITEEAIRAIVVSAETRSGGAAINKRRGDKGWVPLEVFEIDVLDAGGVEPEDGLGSKESFLSKISSTTIRKQRMEARATQGP